MLALAVAGLFAILLVLSRAPITGENAPWPENFFQKGLVTHVALSFAVWFLAVYGAINSALILPKNQQRKIALGILLDRTALGLSTAGTLGLLIPTFQDYGEPTLNNYIPVIINPIYYSGLILLATGIFLSAARVLINVYRLRTTTAGENLILSASGLIYVTAIVALIIARAQLGETPVDHDFNEHLFWGAGHILQVMNAGLFLAGLSLLFRQSFGRSFASAQFYYVTGGLLMLVALSGLSFFGLYPTGTAENTGAFTNSKYFLGVPVLMVLVTLIRGLWRHRNDFNITDPAALSLLTSLVLFTTGAVFGLFVDGADTRTPAHYHGVIGGINLVFVGLFYSWFLPLVGRRVRQKKLMIWQIGFYALGQWLFIIGMFAVGGMGASRKVMGAGIDIESVSAIIATSIRDVGGGLAIIGGVLFILISLKALFRAADPMP